MYKILSGAAMLVVAAFAVGSANASISENAGIADSAVFDLISPNTSFTDRLNIDGVDAAQDPDDAIKPYQVALTKCQVFARNAGRRARGHGGSLMTVVVVRQAAYKYCLRNQ